MEKVRILTINYWIKDSIEFGNNFSICGALDTLEDAEEITVTEYFDMLEQYRLHAVQRDDLSIPENVGNDYGYFWFKDMVNRLAFLESFHEYIEEYHT